MNMKFAARIAAMGILLLLGVVPIVAHEGHDHETAPPVIASASPRAEASSDSFELVAIRRGGGLEIWIDRFETNAPVTTASVEVETPDGQVTAAISPDGSYRIPAPWAEKAGQYDLIVTVTDGSDLDILTATLEIPRPATADDPAATRASGLSLSPSQIAAGGSLALGVFVLLIVRPRPLYWAPLLAVAALAGLGVARTSVNVGPVANGTLAAPPPIMQDRSQIAPDGSVFVPKPTQRILNLRNAFSQSAEHNKTLELPGRVIPDPNRSGLVQASVSGRLSPPAGGFPRLGASVKAGQVFAYVTAPYAAIDQSAMRQQAGDLDQQISIVERRLSRSELLAKTGALAAVTLEETRLELQGLRDRRLALDQVKREPEALVAPVDGIVSSTNAVAGQIADANTILFHIIDPKSLWVEALAFEVPPDHLTASALTADSRSLELQFVGAGFTDRNQAAPIHFALKDPQGVRLGQFVTVLAQAIDTISGIAAPRKSIVRRSNGESIVFEHIRAEHFESRTVRTLPLDAERVLIVSGLSAGKRIVTDAAELLNQVR